MTILNQTSTGRKCPNDVKMLRDKLYDATDGFNGSFMRYTKVHCWSLAMLLDRLEVLEKFAIEINQVLEEKIKSV